MKRPQGVQGQTRQDILNQRLAFQKTRVEALQKAIDARQELMKVLTPEQVKCSTPLNPAHTPEAQEAVLVPDTVVTITAATA